MGVQRFLNIIEQFSNKSLIVLGDIILDEYIWGDVERICPEAPVPVVNITSRSFVLGGAANVVDNVRSLGGRGSLCGVVGGDEAGQKILHLLKSSGINMDGVALESKRPTTQKSRVIARKQQVVRFDLEETKDIDCESQEKIFSFLQSHVNFCDAIIISDYAKGVVTHNFLQEIVSLCRKHGKMIIADPKRQDFLFYKGVTMLTPNKKEAWEFAKKCDVPPELEKVGSFIMEKMKSEKLVITLGEEGIAIFDKEKGIQKIPTVARQVFEVSGAGDAVISSLTLALTSGATLEEAALIANHAAGVVVGKVGTATVTPTELKESLSGIS